MNESTGQSIYDYGGVANNTGQLGSTSGSDTNDPTWNTTSQKFGASALSFDGNDDYATMGDKDIFSFTDNKFTISFWMKANNTTSPIGIIGKRGSPWEYSIYASTGGTLNFSTYTSDGANFVYPNITATYDTNWNNFVFTADNTLAHVYKNGILVGSSVKNANYSMSNTVMELEIGRGGNSGGLRYMNGSIDEVKISNRALSPEEIKQDAQYSPYGVYTSSVMDLGTSSPTWLNFSWNEYGVRTSSVENDINTTNLVAQWNFNETSGTTATNNAGSCGTSCNGTLTNFTNTSAQDAVPLSGWTYENRLEYGADGDGSLMFDGVDDYVSVPDNSSLNPVGPFTVSTWFKAANISSQTIPPIIKKSSNSSGYSLEINNSTQNIAFWVYTTSGWVSSSTYKVASGNWYYATGVYDGSYLRLYINGTEIGSPVAASSTIMSSNPLNLGRDPVNTTRFFSGTIESPKIYSRALSTDEINSNYQAGNIEFQTRTGSDTTPEDGGWEDWKSTGTATETVVDNMDNDYQPSSISGLRVWLKADAITGIVNGGQVTTWSDSSGNGINFTQATSTKQPTYVRNAINGKPALHFTASTQQTMTNATNFSTPNTIFYVSRQTGGTKARLLSGLSNNWLLGYHGGNKNMAYFEGWVSSGGITADNDWHIYSSTQTASLSTVYENGAQLYSNANGVTGPNGLSLNGYQGTSEFSDGDIAELIIFNSALSDTDRQKVNNYLNNKYNPSYFATQTDTNLKVEGIGSQRCIIGQVQSDANTVGLWHLEETNGSGTYIKDSSGNGNHGTPTGTTPVNAVGGKARNFSGNNEYIDFGTNTSLDLGNTFTISAWVKADTLKNYSGIVSKVIAGRGGTYSYMLVMHNDGKIGAYSPESGWVFSENAGIVAEQWYYLTWIFANGKIYYYVNGIPFGYSNFSYTDNVDHVVYAGSWYSLANVYDLDGSIDEINISNISRTSEEIAEAYRMGANYHITRSLSSPINLATTNNKLPFQIASDRPGTSLMLTLGESAYANYEVDNNTIGYWPLEENFSGGTNTMRECTDADPIGTTCGGGKKFATGLVAMPSGCANSTSEPTCSGTDSQTKTWASAYGTNEPADSTTDGLGNTNNLYNSDPPTNLAANFCHDLIKTGYSDWYLPARTELNALNNQRTIIGGFASSYYWTSTEYNVSPYYYAYVQVFSGTTQTYVTKVTPYYYRCIRQYYNSQNVIKDTGPFNLSGQAVGTSPTQGKFGKGRYFNGTSDYIRVEDINNLYNTNTFTIEAWVKPDSLTDGTTSMKIAGKIGNDLSGNCGYGYSISLDNTNKFETTIDPSGCGNSVSSRGITTPEPGKWYHIVGTYNGTTAKIYVNGVLENSSVLPAVNLFPSYFLIGNQYSENLNQYTNPFKGVIDEVRLSNVVRTPNEIRQVYESGLRSHPITIDFGAGLDSVNLIANSSDLSFSINATSKGLPTRGANLFVGDKIIVKENYNGTEYLAQGTVTSVNRLNGAVTVAGWDSGSTFPSIGYSYAADVFKWQKENVSIYGSLAGHRDEINKISLRILDGNQGQNIWLDDLKVATPLMTNPTTNTVQSTPNRYFQYRFFANTTDTDPTPSVDDVELDYSTLEITGASTSQSYISTNNNTAFNIQCNGATDGTTGNNVDCEASFNQTNWYVVGSATSPLSNQTIQGTPDISSWTGYPSGDGAVTIYARAHNTVNATYSTIRNFSVNKDVSRPTVTAITSVAGDTTAPYSDGTDNGSTLVVYTSSADATACRWSTTDQAYTAMTNTCTSNTNCTLDLSSKGQKDVYIGCIDSAANISQPNYHLTYHIDVDPDIVAVDAGQSSSDRTSLTSDTWFDYADTGSDDQISFSWTDPASPSDDTFYYVLNSTATNYISDGSEAGVATTSNNYLDDISINENTSYMHVRAKNGVNSWGTERIFIVKYDKTNPTISADNASDQWHASNPTITLSTADTFSGLNFSKYSWDSDDTTCRATGTDFNNNDTINIISSGSHVLYLCNEDNVGNQSSWNGIYKLDTSTPDIISIDAGPSSSDRTSLTSDNWFNYLQTGSDDQISFSWTDPASTSDDYFYYLENDSTTNAFNETGLVGWWSFENDNTTTAFDHSGSGNHGALSGSSLTAGQLGNARSFDGINDHVTIPSSTELHPLNAITVSAWVKRNSVVSSYDALVCTDPNSGGDDFYLQMYDPYWRFYIQNTSGAYGDAISTSTINNGVWTHVSGVYDGSNISLYINGQLEDSNSFTGNIKNSNGDIYISWSSVLRRFNGDIDEVKIFDRALNSSEITNEYLRRLTTNPYLDNQPVAEGTFVKHIRPLSGADTWGSERQFVEKYDKTAPMINSITSVAGDTTLPYFDTTDDGNTLVVYTSSDNLNLVEQCKWSTSDETYSAMANTCTNTTNCTLNLTGDGAKTAYMRCRDNIGNEATSSFVINYTIDSNPPAVLSITSVAGDTTAPYKDNTDNADTAVVYTASGDAVACRWSTIDQNYESMVDICTDTSNCALNLTGEGTHSIYMRCIDGAGLTSPTSYTYDYAIDTTPPTITTITSVAGDTLATYYDNTDDSETPILFTTSGDPIECKWSNTDQAYDSMPNICSAPGNCTANLSGQGAKTVYLRCKDDVENKMTTSTQVDYIIDSIAPGVLSITSVANDFIAPYLDTTIPYGQAPVVYVASADATACRWSINNVEYDSMTNTCASTTNCTITHSGDGEKNIFFRCTDAANNKSPNSYQLDFEVDENINGGGIRAEETSSQPSDPTNFFITFTPELTNPAAVNGSIRIRLESEYDLSTLTHDDVFAAGGDVIWTDDELIYPDNNIIVFPFTGDLNNDDGQISLTLANLQTINPGSTGSFFISYDIFDNPAGTGTSLESGDGMVHLNYIVIVTASVPSFLEATINPVGVGENINGNITNIATSNGQVVDFGTFTGADDRIAAHDIAISTNANSGYQVSIEYDHSLAAGTNFVPDFVGTNTNPLSWQTPPGSGIEAYFGYTTEDDSLWGAPTDRFVGGKWSGFATEPQEVIYENHTVDNQITRIGYRLQISGLQGVGFYNSNISYIITSTY